MKKLSISLFAVLAILFAVSSAFTSKSNKFVQNRWERFGVQNNQATGASSASTVYSKRITDNFKQVFTAVHNDIDAEISAYNTAHPLPQPQITCSFDAVNLCAAIAKYNTVPTVELAIEDFNLGDYAL